MNYFAPWMTAVHFDTTHTTPSRRAGGAVRAMPRSSAGVGSEIVNPPGRTLALVCAQIHTKVGELGISASETPTSGTAVLVAWEANESICP